MSMSLRGRITLWYALAVPSVIFVLAFTAQQVMLGVLHAKLDEGLERRAEMVRAAITMHPEGDPESYPDLVERLTDDQLPSMPLLLRLIDTGGTVSATYGDIPAPVMAVLDRQMRMPIEDRGRFDNVHVHGVEALRIYTVPVHSPDGDPLIMIQVGDSLAAVAAAKDWLWRLTLVEGAVGSLVTLAVGMLIMRRGFRPLDAILERVHQMESNNLTHGLPPEPRPPELEKLAQSLNNMWRRLDMAFKARQTFVANVSHDLRTPLTALQGQIDVLMMEPSLNTDLQGSLARMAREVRRLARMADNLLLDAQLEGHPVVAAEAVNLNDLGAEVVAQMRVLANGVRLEMSATSDNIVVPGDYDLLKQMLLNIVDNAIKFTPAGGRVQVSVQRQDGVALLRVVDTGSGITSEHMPHVMDAFYQADNRRSSASGGVGLGLSIVKQIVELHGGQVHVRSRPDQGTMITVRLSAWESQAPAAAAAKDDGAAETVVLEPAVGHTGPARSTS